MPTNVSQIHTGAYIPPVRRISLFSPNEWESFIEEWVEIKKNDYFWVDNHWGAWDMWRDVIWYIENPQLKPDNYEWDCYQCKHYKNPLTPTNVYVEFGKLLYYTFNKKYPIPNNYFFVSPHGIWTDLNDLLNHPLNLKKKIVQNWDKYCKDKITKSDNIKLEWLFLDYVNGFDFKIFKKIKVKAIIEEHKKHPDHLKTFWWSLKEREDFSENDMPGNIQKHELNYIKKLLNAYESHGNIQIKDSWELVGLYNNHFSDARLWFYYAEQLERLYRDSLPIWTFNDFKGEILDWVKGLNYIDYPNWFEKVVKIEQESKKVEITSNPLINVSVMKDRVGICHHLSNEDKLTWISNE